MRNLLIVKRLLFGFAFVAICAFPLNAVADTLPSGERSHGNVSIEPAYNDADGSIIYLLTGGGPAGATETLVVRIYNTAFRFYDFSYSATLGVAGFLMAMSIVVIFMAVQKHNEADTVQGY